jgi:hypothetical protein
MLRAAPELDFLFNTCRVVYGVEVGVAAFSKQE